MRYELRVTGNSYAVRVSSSTRQRRVRELSEAVFGQRYRLELMVEIARSVGIVCLSDLARELDVTPSNLQRPLVALTVAGLLSKDERGDSRQGLLPSKRKPGLGVRAGVVRECRRSRPAGRRLTVPRPRRGSAPAPPALPTVEWGKAGSTVDRPPGGMPHRRRGRKARVRRRARARGEERASHSTPTPRLAPPATARPCCARPIDGGALTRRLLSRGAEHQAGKPLTWCRSEQLLDRPEPVRPQKP